MNGTATSSCNGRLRRGEHLLDDVSHEYIPRVCLDSRLSYQTLRPELHRIRAPPLARPCASPRPAGGHPSEKALAGVILECLGATAQATRRGRYNVARLIAKHGDAQLPELAALIADCPKTRTASVYDRCKLRRAARQ